MSTEDFFQEVVKFVMWKPGVFFPGEKKIFFLSSCEWEREREKNWRSKNMMWINVWLVGN